ncbi:Uncharacterised protein [Mycobacteroides abscessus subsp. bolletii]|nr:hypothetical protein [Mycobacteroides abscessus]SHX93316.1 Uncharacterised protein [Mycobacteroides abscessus subsp. bolletii]SKP82174.1 Uncharacterised protein [Mycobacteroides abscessus subsp. bolletii]SKP99775.1 Uncharacterised protein [Mycobacteroides abscessus subsp. bolletii]SKQ16250.1 Uncharacterised protein [Mycobacteroides abscessus subsp. bolletii]
MNLHELAVERGFTVDSSPDDQARIAAEIVHREFYPSLCMTPCAL